MSFERVKGQKRTIQLLKNALEIGRVAHAYCFTGPNGTGKETAAIELAKALNCETNVGEACDDCRSCRRISHDNHPDIVRLKPDGQSIKIGQVRELQQRFSYTSSEGTTRVVILRNAEKLTLQAANSLLKFLEEPVSRMVAILLTETAHALLPTIRSRCQILHFSPLHPTRIEETLIQEGLDPNISRIVSHLATNVDEARQLAECDEFAPLCERMVEWNGEIASGKSDPLVEIQTKWMVRESKQEEIEQLLDLSLLWLRDLLHYKLATKEEYVFSGWKDSLRRQASQWTLANLMSAMDKVIQARKALAGSVQPQAVLEQMVLAMQGGFNHDVSRRSPFQASG
ncbi:DNA polymerase III subunit delta' [Melghirimyces algeriensis]|uniref:DNA polymerase-3 subunit delta n=1 Tax=Melghirimyces algeriensis TaxID=910412 RepID=A0A521ECJ7_9BACL|nr:DNA polymerase III subunit delta' [Melghirimyces algeriensis]SMO81654.1 DNA polymerase-3 subunit delta' [Melghirimyces algeriensis]